MSEMESQRLTHTVKVVCEEDLKTAARKELQGHEEEEGEWDGTKSCKP